MTAIRDALRAIIDTLDAEEMGEGPPASEHVAHWQKLHDDGTAALDAETEVKVRELEWTDNSSEEYAIRHDGRCGDFHYVARAVRAGDMILAAGRYHSSVEAAKAAAQADFERRIRSELVPPEARS